MKYAFKFSTGEIFKEDLMVYEKISKEKGQNISKKTTKKQKKNKQKKQKKQTNKQLNKLKRRVRSHVDGLETKCMIH